MPWHTVEQGEDIPSIAAQYDIDNWEIIWDHPENASLRRERPDPYVLAPDDRVFVPDYRGQVFVVESGNRHDLVLPDIHQRWVRLTLANSRNGPFVEKDFTLTVGNETVEGTTTPEGALEVILPVNASSADLTLFPRSGNDELKHEWRLQLGYLNPLDRVSGVKARLRNLGYNISEVNDTEDDELGNAIELFRARIGIEVNRIIDDELRRHLRLAHGGT